MLYVPEIEECISFAKDLGCSDIIEIPIEPREFDTPFTCHKNCEFNPVMGVYFAKDSNNILHAFKHSVLRLDDRLVDVTPTLDQRLYNIFAYGADIKHEHFTYIESTVFINKEERTEMAYYVYGLIDPRDNQVFYIGKGKDNRALSHFIETLKPSRGRPMIEFYAQNIDDEDLAQKIEASLCSKYGIKNENIITN